MGLIWVHSGVDCKVMRYPLFSTPPCLHPPPSLSSLNMCWQQRSKIWTSWQGLLSLRANHQSAQMSDFIHRLQRTGDNNVQVWSQTAHIQKPSVIWAHICRHINIHIKYLQVNWLVPRFRCIDYQCVTVSYLYGNCIPSGLPHCQWWTSMASLSLTKTMSSELLQTDTSPNKATLWSS